MPVTNEFFKVRKRFFVVSVGVLIFVFISWKVPIFNQLIKKTFLAKKTVQQQVDNYISDVEERLQPVFKQAGAELYASDLSVIVFKDTGEVKLFAKGQANNWVYLKTYKMTAKSGTIGPKLTEGDSQIPEGIYAIESLNPNSRFHLSLRLNYPNDFDKKMAKIDERKKLGTDIMIHGGAASVGCVSIGDKGIEELFVLAAKSSYSKWKIIISPNDLRRVARPTSEKNPDWLPELDKNLIKELRLILGD